MSVKCILWQFVKAPLRMRVELCLVSIPAQQRRQTRAVWGLGLYIMASGGFVAGSSEKYRNATVIILQQSKFSPAPYFLFLGGKCPSASPTHDILGLLSGQRILNVNQMKPNVGLPRLKDGLEFPLVPLRSLQKAMANHYWRWNTALF